MREAVAGRVGIRESHCVRVRFVDSSCSRCLEACPHGALRLDGAPEIDEGLCLGCYACVAACPTAAMEAHGVHFWEVTRLLAAVPAPVLGCERAAGSGSHAAVPCLGILTREHIVALCAFLPDGVTLNMTACAECDCAPAVRLMELAVDEVRPIIEGADFGHLTLAHTPGELCFEELATDRRAFLKQFAQMIRVGASKLLVDARDLEIGDTPYWEKIAPRKRQVIETVFEHLKQSEASAAQISLSATLGRSATLRDTCEACFACVGACPNGALEGAEIEGPFGECRVEMRFFPVLCGDCGLCEEFCISESISIARGCTAEEFENGCELRGSSVEPEKT